jgi:ABC-2 type transport system ATP-binding protein
MSEPAVTAARLASQLPGEWRNGVENADTVLQVEGLTKIYKSLFTAVGVKAVDNLSLSIRRGETYSIVGPNGSGKTTTLKILLGLIFPTSGRTTIFGKSVSDLAVRERVGFLPEDAYLYDCFNGEELLDFYAGLFGYPRKKRAQLVDELLSLVGMQANRKVPFRECSKGMRQRLALAQALVNDPELLVLDEPTSGLDPAGRHQMTLLIQEMKKRGKTLLLCSHFLAEVEEVCDRVGILYAGKLVSEGSLQELAGAPTEVVISTQGLKSEAQDALSKQPGFKNVESGAVRIDGAVSQAELWGYLDLIRNSGAEVLELLRPRPTLQDVFVKAIGSGVEEKQ